MTHTEFCKVAFKHLMRDFIKDKNFKFIDADFVKSYLLDEGISVDLRVDEKLFLEWFGPE